MPGSSMMQALKYLACPECKNKLGFRGNNKNNTAPALVCTVCKKRYEVLDGVPYFSRGQMPAGTRKQILARNLAAEDLKNKTAGEIKAHIKQLAKSGGTGFAACFFEMARTLSKEGLSKPDALEEIFSYGTDLAQTLGGKNCEPARQEILQATSTTRYNLDVYRGCYALPDKVLEYLRGALAQTHGLIIFEGAMGPGDNLLNMSDVFGREKKVFGIGIDLSEKMALEAEKKARGRSNIFFSEGDLEKIPVKSGIVDCIVLNNALDRVCSPKKVAKEFNRISKPSAVFALFNCFPLQYVSPDGVMDYVPKGERLDLRTMVKESGFSVAKEYGPRDLPPWVLETIFGGRAALSMTGVVGVKKG